MTDEPFKASDHDWQTAKKLAESSGGNYARALLEVRDRLAAVEARLPWTGTASDVAPQLVPITTPVEPAPQAQQGVTVNELVRVLSQYGDDAGAAYVLWDHPRIGPLLRGEPAPVPVPVRVVLPEEPPLAALNAHAPTGPGAEVYWGACFTTWAAARAEVERQQRGQADG
jgi:hypothetical protein